MMSEIGNREGKGRMLNFKTKLEEMKGWEEKEEVKVVKYDGFRRG